MNFVKGEVSNIKPQIFPTWNEVIIGTLGSAQKAREQLKLVDKRNIISPWADCIIDKVNFSTIKVKMDLVQVTAEQLGLMNGAKTAEIYDAAASRGLSLCPAEVALQFWLQHPDLLKCGEWYLVAMEPIYTDSDSGFWSDSPSIFRIEYHEILKKRAWLSSRRI